MKQFTKTNNYNGILQKPVHSGFSSASTTADVINGVDLSGRNVIITGGYAGIGLETTRTLAGAGAHIWLPARDVAKAARNLAGIPNVTVMEMDLADPASVDRFATQFLAMDLPLHLLINNAGIMWVPLRRDNRGYESQLSTNHLGHFHLTAKLWPVLKKAGDARVITVSSFGHQMAPFNFEDPNFLHRPYETLLGYGQSKTANILFTVELGRRSRASGVRAFAVHPGSVNGTDLGREAPIGLFKQLGTHDADGNIFPEVASKLKTIAQGAATTVWCAVCPIPGDVSGVYCEDCDVAVVDDGDIVHRYDDPATLYGVKSYALDAAHARLLWTLSEKMTDIAFAVD